MAEGSITESQYVKLYRGSIIPLNACLPGLVWVLHDYLITVQDEARYVWPRKMNIGKMLFLWIRYYGILLLIFDVTQIHSFTIPGITNDTVCVAMDSIIRIVGAFLLWPIEVMMQMRIYALYKASKKVSHSSARHLFGKSRYCLGILVALINFVLFLGSIGAFMWILIHNAVRRHAVIAEAWIPATVFEGVLFFWVLYKSLSTSFGLWRDGTTVPLYSIVLRDNILYFFGIACLLVFNNLMVVGVTKIPWFSYSPFHAAMEIMTSRMLINLYKASTETAIQHDSPNDGVGKKYSTSNSLSVFAAAENTPRNHSDYSDA